MSIRSRFQNKLSLADHNVGFIESEQLDCLHGSVEYHCDDQYESHQTANSFYVMYSPCQL